MLCRPRLSRISASVAAAALSFGLLAVTPGVAQAADKTTFLGLEGDGDSITALSDALRWELNQRGRDDGNTMTIGELKLTMGCGDGDLACLAQGGQALGSSEFVFGTMAKAGGTWTIELQSLDVATGKLNKTIKRQVSEAELGEASIGKTAASLIDELYGATPAVGPVGPTGDGGETAADPSEPDAEPSDEPGTEPAGEQPRGDGELIWGAYSPRPTWKYVGVGVSAGLTAISLGTAIGTTVAIGPNGPVRADLLDAAEASLTDANPNNDIDPNTSADLCPLATEQPDPNSDAVRNAEMTKICDKATTLATTATATWVLTGVFAASTVVFTTLLFVHKDKPGVAKLIEHDVGLGGMPLREGGFVLGGSARF